jgi:L-fuconolactonase
MMIVDAQVHIWAAHTPERPWPADGHARTHRDIPLGAEELCREMDAAGVDRAVLVPPSWEGDYNDLALQAAADHPGRFAVMGRLDLGDPSNAARLPDWRSQPGMLGIRASFLMPAQRQWLAEQSIDWFWKGAEAAGVPLMILPPDQLPAIDRVVRKYPDLRVIVDHLAMTSSRRDAEAFAAVDDLLPLARHPNVAVKSTALPCYTTEPYPFAGIRSHIERVYDAFGPARMFWGTDLSRLPCGYRQAITHFTEELPFLSESDKELIMGRGICDWLGWPV